MNQIFFTLLLLFFAGICGAEDQLSLTLKEDVTKKAENRMESIIVGGGCFWCVEAVFQQFKGVEGVESGYAGGSTENPSYESVSSGRSGHAEVIKLTYDPTIITLQQLLTIFFHAHDPTTKDRQGQDVGTQYRSVIFYSIDEQKVTAETVKREIEQEKLWKDVPIVTEIQPLKKFYPAEDYHQNYYNNNESKPYCALVIGPKIQKARKEFKELLR